MKTDARQSERGFTLVEIMVSLMIFSLVVVVALAALVKIVDANRKAQTLQDAVVNLSFSLESMSREVRTGSNLLCQQLAPGTDLSATQLASQSIAAACSSGASGAGGNGIGFAFRTSRLDPSCSSGDKHLLTAYEIVPNRPGGAWDGTFSLNKATQTSCTTNIGTLFSPIVATSTVSITGYYFQASNASYPLVFVYLDGVAGTKESGKTTFSLQTASSMRLP